jgi:carbonic anhydrase/acetyltransferase-like protein (isoleucine patch superfamily)
MDGTMTATTTSPQVLGLEVGTPDLAHDSWVAPGATVGDDVLVAAGTVLLEGTEIPSGSLVAGVPGKVRRPLTGDEAANIRSAAKDYEHMTRLHSVAQHVG